MISFCGIVVLCSLQYFYAKAFDNIFSFPVHVYYIETDSGFYGSITHLWVDKRIERKEKKI